ncbi:MAG: TatD family hydrolase [Bacteroidales bacterium]
MPFVNFHTHLPKYHEDEIAIRSIMLKDFKHDAVSEPCTVGIHPWETDTAISDEQIERLNSIMQNANVIGVGEVGLDKLKGGELEIQERIFNKQIDIAYKHGKPLVIHCIKAWDILLKSRSEKPKGISWGIHGFNGNAMLAKQLTNAGFYISVGAHLLNPKSKIARCLATIPKGRLLFETDEDDLRVEQIYVSASKIIGMPLTELKELVYDNYKCFFANKLLDTR